jgi:hypothetical protein
VLRISDIRICGGAGGGVDIVHRADPMGAAQLTPPAPPN